MKSFSKLLENTASAWGSCPVWAEGIHLTWGELIDAEGLLLMLFCDFAEENKITIVPMYVKEGMLDEEALPLSLAPVNTIHLHLSQASERALFRFEILNINMPTNVFKQFMLWFKKEYDLAVEETPKGYSFLSQDDIEFNARYERYIEKIFASRQKMDVI